MKPFLTLKNFIKEKNARMTFARETFTRATTHLVTVGDFLTCPRAEIKCKSSLG